MSGTLTDRLAAYFEANPDLGVSSVYLYGSHAEGRAHRESDVDVAVLLDWQRHPDKAERFDTRVSLTADVMHALGFNDVDLRILNDVSPELGRKVIYDGIRVYCSDPEADHAYVRDVQILAADLVPWLERMRKRKLEGLAALSFLVGHLVELRRHLAHLRALEPRVRSAGDLKRDLTLHNIVLFSLLKVCQLLIDVAGELSSRKKLRYHDYSEAVTNLSAYEEFSEDLVSQLRPLPGFRNVVLHEYVELDLDRVVDALRQLEPLERFARGLGELVQIASRRVPGLLGERIS